MGYCRKCLLSVSLNWLAFGKGFWKQVIPKSIVNKEVLSLSNSFQIVISEIHYGLLVG